MSDAFALLDLPSQALAVERLLNGRTEDEKLAWLGAHGRLTDVSTSLDSRPVYLFESTIGLRCLFFIAGGKLVFFNGDTFYTVNEVNQTSCPDRRRGRKPQWWAAMFELEDTSRKGYAARGALLGCLAAIVFWLIPIPVVAIVWLLDLKDSFGNA